MAYNFLLVWSLNFHTIVQQIFIHLFTTFDIHIVNVQNHCKNGKNHNGIETHTNDTHYKTETLSPCASFSLACRTPKKNNP